MDHAFRLLNLAMDHQEGRAHHQPAIGLGERGEIKAGLVRGERVQLLEQEGVKFVCNANIGVTHEVAQLRKDFDAIVMCTGATLGRDLNAPGRVDLLAPGDVNELVFSGWPVSASNATRKKPGVVM